MTRQGNSITVSVELPPQTAGINEKCLPQLGSRKVNEEWMRHNILGECFEYPSIVLHCWFGDTSKILRLNNPCHLSPKFTQKMTNKMQVGMTNTYADVAEFKRNTGWLAV